jgi:hypothetical protein
MADTISVDVWTFKDLVEGLAECLRIIDELDGMLAVDDRTHVVLMEIAARLAAANDVLLQKMLDDRRAASGAGG